MSNQKPVPATLVCYSDQTMSQRLMFQAHGTPKVTGLNGLKAVRKARKAGENPIEDGVPFQVWCVFEPTKGKAKASKKAFVPNFG